MIPMLRVLSKLSPLSHQRILRVESLTQLLRGYILILTDTERFVQSTFLQSIQEVSMSFGKHFISLVDTRIHRKYGHSLFFCRPYCEREGVGEVVMRVLLVRVSAHEILSRV